MNCWGLFRDYLLQMPRDAYPISEQRKLNETHFLHFQATYKTGKPHTVPRYHGRVVVGVEAP